MPVIAKADTLSPKEAADLKKKVMKELESHEIKVYQLPECDEDEDEEIKRTDHDLKVRCNNLAHFPHRRPVKRARKQNYIRSCTETLTGFAVRTFVLNFFLNKGHFCRKAYRSPSFQAARSLKSAVERFAVGSTHGAWLRLRILSIRIFSNCGHF